MPESSSSSPNQLSKRTLALVTAVAIGGGAVGAALESATHHDVAPCTTSTAAAKPEIKKTPSAPKAPSAEQVSMATSYQKAASNFGVKIVQTLPDYGPGGAAASVYNAFGNKVPNFDGAAHDKITIASIEDPKDTSVSSTTYLVELVVASNNPSDVQKISVAENDSLYKGDANGTPLHDKNGAKELENESTSVYTISNVAGKWSADLEVDYLGNNLTDKSHPAHLQDTQKFIETMAGDLETLGILETK